jgi:hypothetical protein
MRWVDGVLFVLDHFEGDGTHHLEQFWHPGGAVRFLEPDLLELPAGVYLHMQGAHTVNLEEGGAYGWYSSAPGVKASRPLIIATLEAPFPCTLACAFQFSPARAQSLSMIENNTEITLTCGSRQAVFSYR